MVNNEITALILVCIILFSAFLHLGVKSYVVSIDWDAEYQKAKELEERIKKYSDKLRFHQDRIEKLTSKQNGQNTN